MNASVTVPAGVAALTVSQINSAVRDHLETDFRSVWVVGEVSKVTLHRSGHLYIDLKDAGSVLHAVMWRTSVQRLSDLPQLGTEVFVHGRATVYPPQGNYQLNIDQLFPKGAGAQDLALRRLKERLHKLGYFAAERKRPLPGYPRRIAVIASPTGAAIRDVLETLRRRWPVGEVWVVGVRVQGPDAPDNISAALALLNRVAGIDVVILARGGGSTDDLAAFNHERVATAIFRSKVPVVSAIGHEINVTIADLVADGHALTPTDAANMVVPDQAKLREELRVRLLRMHDRLQSKLLAVKNRLLDLAQRRVFCQPLERLRDRERDLDERGDRLLRAVEKRVQLAQRSAEVAAAKLESLSPLNVLARGYSLTRTLPARQVVRSVEQVQPGDAVEIVVNDGRLTARVEAKTGP